MAGHESNLKLTFEKGLFEGQEDSLCPPGSAVTLENWQPEPNGALRCRRGWTAASTTSAPATRKARGIGRYPKPQAFATPAFVQKVNGAFSTNTLQVNLTGAATAGSAVVAIIGISGAGITVVGPDPTVSALMSEGWVKAPFHQENTSANQRLEVWYRLNVPDSAGTTVTFTLSGTPTRAQLHALEFSDVATVNAYDRAAGTRGTSATPGSGTTALTRTAAEMAVAAICISSNANFSSPSNSFTERSDAADASGLSMATWSKALTSIGAQSMTATASVSGNYTGIVFTLRAKKSTTEVSGNYVFVAQDNATSYQMYNLLDTNLAAGSWTNAESVTVSATTRYVAMAAGFDLLFYVSPQFSSVRCWDNTTAVAITQAPAGRCLAVHKNTLFTAGTFQDPSRLYYSDIGDFATFGINNYIDVEGEGGIEDIEPFQGSLLIGKPTSLHLLTGSGRDSFSVEQLNGGGAAPGKSICSTPYGAVIAGTNAVYLFTGAVETISTPIADSYAITGDFVTTAYNDGVVRICDEGSGIIYCFRLLTGQWWIEKTQNLTTDGPSCIFGRNQYLYYGPQNSTTMSLLNYRTEPGSSRAKDSSLTETFKAWTPEMWLGNSDKGFTVRHLHVQWRQRGGTTGQTGITVTPIFFKQDGNDTGTALTISPKASAGVYRTRLDVGEKKGVFAIQLKLEQTVGTAEAALIDLESMDIDVDIEGVR